MTQLARPLPVEYLLVDMGAAFPVEPQYTFKKAEKPFPVENRNAVGDAQVSVKKKIYDSQDISDMPDSYII